MILDRSFTRNDAGALGSREDGLLYLGSEAMSAGLALRSDSQAFEDFQRLLDHQRRRWAVRLGIVDGGYILTLSDFAVALSRTRERSRRDEKT